MTVIALDVMGGDKAPDINIDGAKDFLTRVSDVSVKLLGPAELLRTKTAGWDAAQKSRTEIIDAPTVITPDESPVHALKTKQDSTIAVGMNMLRNGEADALISAGSTGAVLAGGQLLVGRRKGVIRSPLATMIPTKKGFKTFLDCGANVDAKPEWLVQFARMGSIYMEKGQGVNNPVVKLINLGVEEEKGNALTKAVHAELLKAEGINYQGFIESSEVAEGNADVMVADAFTGNAIIKTYEGTAGMLMDVLKDVFKSTLMTKLAAAIIMKPLKARLSDFDVSKCGGAVLLGLRGVVVKCHGNAKPKDISLAMEKAVKYVNEDINGIIERALNERQA